MEYTTNIKVKGSFKKAKLVLAGGDVFKSNYYNQTISKYLLYMKQSNTNESLLQNLHYLISFIDYLEDNKIYTFKKIKSILVNKYIYLFDNQNYSYYYSDRNKMNIKIFFNWLYDNNLSLFSGNMLLPKIVWRGKTSIKDTYTKNEVMKLLNSINIKTKDGKELYLILNLICYLGLRISDVVNLKISSFNFKKNTILINQQKNKRSLILPMTKNIKYALIDYLKNVRPLTNDIDYIFITATKPYRQKTEIKNYGYKIKEVLINAEIDIKNRKSSFHIFRNTLASLLLQENVSLYNISNILGHSCINSTMSYVNIDFYHLKDFALEVPLC